MGTFVSAKMAIVPTPSPLAAAAAAIPVKTQGKRTAILRKITQTIRAVI
jgi:hypothetical protein